MIKGIENIIGQAGQEIYHEPGLEIIHPDHCRVAEAAQPLVSLTSGHSRVSYQQPTYQHKYTLLLVNRIVIFIAIFAML